jgi:hypothetical protein
MIHIIRAQPARRKLVASCVGRSDDARLTPRSAKDRSTDKNAHPSSRSGHFAAALQSEYGASHRRRKDASPSKVDLPRNILELRSATTRIATTQAEAAPTSELAWHGVVYPGHTPNARRARVRERRPRRRLEVGRRGAPRRSAGRGHGRRRCCNRSDTSDHHRTAPAWKRLVSHPFARCTCGKTAITSIGSKLRLPGRHRRAACPVDAGPHRSERVLACSPVHGFGSRAFAR